jgi:hypothetical protein
MKHPDPEEWVAYLYEEIDPNTRCQLKAHLAECQACRLQLDHWQCVRQRLDSWKRPGPRPRGARFLSFPALARWAAAAALMIGFGFLVGRSSILSGEQVAALREELRGEVAQMVEAQMRETNQAWLAAAEAQTRSAIGELMDFYQVERLADHQAIATALSRLDAARTADFLSIRTDLETVALNSDLGLRQTRQQLVRLADLRQSTSLISPDEP